MAFIPINDIQLNIRWDLSTVYVAGRISVGDMIVYDVTIQPSNAMNSLGPITFGQIQWFRESTAPGTANITFSTDIPNSRLRMHCASSGTFSIRAYVPLAQLAPM